MESWQETGLAFGIDTAMSGVFILWETWWWSQQVVLIFKLENQMDPQRVEIVESCSCFTWFWIF